MKNLNLLITSMGLVTISALSNCQKEIEVTAPEITQTNETTYYCEKVPFCHGTVQSFVTLNGDKKPIAIGIRFHESLLKGLPSDPAKNIPEVRLKVPKEGKDIGIDHIDFGWNPKGHEPNLIYTFPHFDLHFYKASKAEQAGVIPGPDPILVDPQYIPVNYATDGTAVPNMGVHYVDVTSPEFHNNPFTSTFVYGFYQGKLTFLEPMFTRAFLLTKPQFTAPVKQPAKFKKSGYYPTSYRISYDNATQEYVIVTEGLKFHAGS